ncbi:SDR family NAD(P)-dependent oxidoreductase [Streptomyces sp. JJ66]|nr:SDR family NAD(P)-dependent oxidoreductase [Streptomyces sp. JJ66]
MTLWSRPIDRACLGLNGIASATTGPDGTGRTEEGAVERQITVVTGGSRGIGAAVAVRLAASGHDVAVGFRQDAEAVERSAAAVRAADGRTWAATGAAWCGGSGSHPAVSGPSPGANLLTKCPASSRPGGP